MLKADPEIEDMMLSVICFDEGRMDDVRIHEYFMKEDPTWHFDTPYPEKAVNELDPVIGHGGRRPISSVLEFAREMAQDWVLTAPHGYIHRAVICLLTDGRNDPNDQPDGTAEKEKIIEFNNEHAAKGRIRVAAVGYYQHPKGESAYEDEGRELLHRLADHNAYFETGEASTIAGFLWRTLPPD